MEGSDGIGVKAIGLRRLAGGTLTLKLTGSPGPEAELRVLVCAAISRLSALLARGTSSLSCPSCGGSDSVL